MHRVFRRGLTALILGLLATPAMAELTVYYHAGSWDAFSGLAADGKPVCGIGITNPGDSRSFSVRFSVGEQAVNFQAKKPSWNIPEDTQVPVVMQIGFDAPWTLQGTGKGQVVDWTLDHTQIQAFDMQFRRAGSMAVTFPSGNEAPWTLGLNGSTAISNSFGQCVNQMTARAGQAPAAPAGPTQPFPQTQTQPATQEPTQPVLPPR
jgi:hypothetical protein